MDDLQASAATLKDKVVAEPVTALAWTFALGMSVYGLYYALVFPFESTLYGVVHLVTALILYGLTRIDETESLLVRAFDVGLIALVALSGVYFWLNFGELQALRAVLGYTDLDILMSIAIVVGVAEYTRREYGWVLFFVIIAAMAYGYFGQSMPGFFEHTGLDLVRLLELSVLNFTGAFGRLTVIAALWIFIFMIWAGLLRAYGEIEAFLDLSYLLSRRFKSGIYQIAITASMFVGAIVGSPAGNVVITGNFTIPMMKDRGIEPSRAAAIESVGSTGGMVLPPIMGSAAFIMATLLGMSYGQIIIIAVLPAVMLYALIMISVHFSVLRDRRERGYEEKGEVDRDIDRVELMKSIVPIVLSTTVLVYALAILRYSPTLSGIMTIGVYLAVKIVIALGYREFYPRSFVRNGLDGLAQGAIMMAPITIVLASMNTVVTILASTGLPVKVAVSGAGITGGVLLLILVIVSLVTILFGMGMPISAAYLLAVALMEPLMVEAGVTDIVAHFFILYWAMVSAISPPVALSCAIAANIAGAGFLDTVWESLKVGLPYFILPFAFIANENLILFDGVNSLLAAGAVVVSIIVIMAGVQRIFETRVRNTGAVVAGVALVIPTILVGLV